MSIRRLDPSAHAGPAATLEDGSQFALEIEDLDVHYQAVQALHGVNLRVGVGEMIALLGANGAGKTTTLRAISGLITPTEGSIFFNGEPIGGQPAHVLVGRGIVHVPEGRDLFPTLSVIDNLRVGHWPHRRDKAGFATDLERSMDYFPRLRERANQAAGTLSGGEQQMLVLARALMGHPKVLLVDELSFGLAPIIVEQLFGILARVNSDGTAILLVEQFVHLALEHTHRAYVLAKGEVVLEGRSADLADDPALLAAYLGENV